MFATFLAELSARFVNVRIESVDDEISGALRGIVERLDVDRCSLGRISAGGEFALLSSYSPPGMPPLPPDACAKLPWYADELAHGRIVHLSRAADLPPHADVERAFMRDSGMKSHLGVPISVGGMPLCAMGVSAFRRRMTFPQEFVASLQLIGAVFANALARRENEFRLRRMEAELSHVTRVATVGQLAASIAHEINQPLCAIVSNAQAALRLLRQGKSGVGEARAALRDIAADSKRAGDIVSRSHRLLKPRELSLQPVSMNDIVRDVMMLMHGDMVIRHIRAKTDLQDDLPAVAGDAVQLQQVVLNLFINAADATAPVSDRAREVTIRTETVDGHVRVLVSDNGVGLTPDVAARMFDPFFTTKNNGLGMGLAINRTILEAHGGQIWACANSDRGTTVAFSIAARPSRTRSRHSAPPVH
jgi:signal transduction histidine kinase